MPKLNLAARSRSRGASNHRDSAGSRQRGPLKWIVTDWQEGTAAHLGGRAQFGRRPPPAADKQITLILRGAVKRRTGKKPPNSKL